MTFNRSDRRNYDLREPMDRDLYYRRNRLDGFKKEAPKPEPPAKPEEKATP